MGLPAEFILFLSIIISVVLLIVLISVVGARRSKLPCTVFWGETHSFVREDDDHAVCTGCGMTLKRRDQWVREFRGGK